jgi:outer membrane protein
MKKLSSILMFGVVSLVLITASQAQAETKIATINMEKVFTAYYKTQDSEGKLKDAQTAYKDELDQRMDAYRKNLDSINKLNEDLKNAELSGSAKDEKAGERDAKISESRALEKEITEFRQTREKEIQEQMKRMRDALVEEIMKVVNKQVKAADYDLVFDRSGFSSNNLVPVLLYSRDNYDFSDSVISKLNAGKSEKAVPLSQKAEEPANTVATSAHPLGDARKKSH